LVAPETTETELNHQRMLIGMLIQAMTDSPQDLDRATDDGVNQIPVQEPLTFVSLGVHSWFQIGCHAMSPS
jgi:hypothetical protein